MNTKVLPNEIRRLLNQPRQYVYLLGLAVVIALGVVLFLTVLRVQNAKDTIGRPRADSFECNLSCLNDDQEVSASVCSSAGGTCTIKCKKTNGEEYSISGGICETVSGGGGGGCGANKGKNEACGFDCECYSGDCTNGKCKDAEEVGTTESRCKSGADCGDCFWVAKFYNDNKDNPKPEADNYYEAACSFGKLAEKCGGCEIAALPGINACSIQTATCGLHRGKPIGGAGGTGGTGGQGCNSSSPAPVWSCYQNGINGVGKGNCTWCWAQYNGGGGGGGGTGGSGSCFNNCYGKTGNGSLCTAGCEKDAACVGNCTGSKTKYSSCVMGCVNGTGSGCQDDSDCGNKVCVDGSCVNKGQSHLECVSSSCARVTGAGSNQDGCTTVGATCSGGNTCVDSQCPTGQSCFNNSCQAYHLGCGSDNTCTKVQGTGQSTCTTLGSSCSGGGTCVDSQCATGQACFSGSCKAYHFGCTSSNVCAKLEGAGANTNGCVATGQVCGGELGSCWGNQGVNGRCIDCNGDGIINILDFSCLACNWSEKFTPDQNPSCGTDAND